MTDETAVDSTPPKKNRDHWLMIGCGASFFLFPCLMITPISGKLKEWGSGRFIRKIDTQCKERLGKVSKAINLYAADYDEQFPLAETWVDYTWSYGSKKDPKEESESIFRCPEISMTRTGEFGYAFNDALSGKKASSVEKPDEVALVFDSSDLRRNAHGDPTKLLPSPPRHNKDQNNNSVSASGKILSEAVK